LRIRVNARNKLEKDSDLLIDQVRAIDNKRLAHGPLAIITKDEMKLVYEAVCEVMGMN
jgi:mRNA interferase MazF